MMPSFCNNIPDMDDSQMKIPLHEKKSECNLSTLKLDGNFSDWYLEYLLWNNRHLNARVTFFYDKSRLV